MLKYVKFGPNIKHECQIEKPDVIHVKEFNDDGYAKFSRSFQDCITAGMNVIPIVIDSYGGYVYSLLGMVDIIKSSPVPVATFIGSKAMSCGAVLFSCGTEGYRFIAPTAHIMVHQVSSGAFGKVEDVEISADQAKVLNKQIMSIMSKNCGHPPGYFYKLIAENRYADVYLSPRQAVAHNLANRVGTPKLKVQVLQTVEIEL